MWRPGALSCSHMSVLPSFLKCHLTEPFLHKRGGSKSRQSCGAFLILFAPTLYAVYGSCVETKQCCYAGIIFCFKPAECHSCQLICANLIKHTHLLIRTMYGVYFQVSGIKQWGKWNSSRSLITTTEVSLSKASHLLQWSCSVVSRAVCGCAGQVWMWMCINVWVVRAFRLSGILPWINTFKKM